MKMTRTFVVIFQEANPSRNLDLNNLPSYGRFDVVCRSITSCLFLSNGFRRDTMFVAVFEKTSSFLVIRGDEARGLNPDERSLAGILRDAFSGRHHPGIWYGPGTLETVLKEFGSWNIFVMDPRGKSISQLNGTNVAFILGDHLGFSPKSRKVLSTFPMLSLGVNEEYLTSQTIAIIHYLYDKGA